MSDEPSTGRKLCECGCGKPAPVATYSARAAGIVKGQPTRFISGHNNRGRVASSATRAKLAAAARGNRHSWKNGEHYQRGRLKLYVGRDHPMADKGGYVFEHRLVAAAVIGRMLLVDEHVHHIDLDAANNAPENLVVVSRSEHMRIHWLIRRGADPTAAVSEVLG